MEVGAYDAWLRNREQHRQFLFGDTVAIAPVVGDVAVAPLTTLAFNTRLNIRLTSFERFAAGEMDEAVYNILAAHNSLAKEDIDGALFGICSTDLEYVAQLTSGVISRWERACRRQNHESPFADLVVTDIVESDFHRRDVQLVVETAAAIIEMFTLGYTARRDPVISSHALLMNFVAQRGPVFATAWIKGDVIRDYFEDQTGNAAKGLDKLSPAKLIYLATHWPSAPLQAALRYAKNVNTASSLDNLPSALGWSTEKVSIYFTSGTRREIVRRWPDDPLIGAEWLAHRLDTVYTVENIATIINEDVSFVKEIYRPEVRLRIALNARPVDKLKLIAANARALMPDMLAQTLQWSEAEVKSLFTPGYRRYLMIGSDLAPRVQKIANAFKNTLSIENIANNLGWGEDQVAKIFTPFIRRRIAMHNPDIAMKKVHTVVKVSHTLLQHYRLSSELATFLATRMSIKNAHFAARIAHTELANCPPHTGELIWMWSVATSPKASREVWLRKAAIGKDLGDFVASQYDITDDILPDEPGDYL